MKPKIFAKPREIKAAQIEAGLIQQELAEFAGTQSSWLSPIQSGKVSPSLKLAKRICRVLGKDFNDIFFVQYGDSANKEGDIAIILHNTPETLQNRSERTKGAIR